MTTDETITIRTATDDDWDAVRLLDAHAFGEHQNSEDLAETQILTSSKHVVMAWDGDTPVGVAMHFPMSVTVPGGAQVEVSGVSWVSVAPTHRRRGILRRMFTEQHRKLDAAGAPLSLLTASEATIYGRFGYGPATEEHTVVLDQPAAVSHRVGPACGKRRFGDGLLLVAERAQAAVAVVEDKLSEIVLDVGRLAFR